MGRIPEDGCARGGESKCALRDRGSPRLAPQGESPANTAQRKEARRRVAGHRNCTKNVTTKRNHQQTRRFATVVLATHVHVQAPTQRLWAASILGALLLQSPRADTTRRRDSTVSASASRRISSGQTSATRAHPHSLRPSSHGNHTS